MPWRRQCLAVCNRSRRGVADFRIHYNHPVTNFSSLARLVVAKTARLESFSQRPAAAQTLSCASLASCFTGGCHMAFEFSDDTKSKIYARQQGVCAHCGERGIANYHHVVPRQSGDPNNMMHGWVSTDVNGVGLCVFDHKAVHIGDDAE